jgi:asparagine synthase (glutamine-hydrolysing)
LEVRVPFCDHRLVEYVFNIPWHLKTFDGREKSILRAATRELLPDSIVEREKNPYPSMVGPLDATYGSNIAGPQAMPPTRRANTRRN